MSKRFLFKVATEVNQTVDTLAEYLRDELGINVPERRQPRMKFPIDDAIHDRILLRFSATGATLTKLQQEEEKSKIAEQEHLKIEEMIQKKAEKEIEKTSGETSEKPKKRKRKIPKYKLEIIRDAEPEKKTEKVTEKPSTDEVEEPPVEKVEKLPEKEKKQKRRGKIGKQVGLKVIKEAEPGEISQREKDRKAKQRKKPSSGKVTKVNMKDIAWKVQKGAHKKKGKKSATSRKSAASSLSTAQSVKKMLAELAGKKQKKGVRKKATSQENTHHEIEEVPTVERKGKINVTEFLSVEDIAQIMGIKPNEVIQRCLLLGKLVTINQRLDRDTIELVADELGFDVEFIDEKTTEETIEIQEYSDDELEERPPVITIMGHVDHGKTSLLDYIRETNVVAGESGGITQHIGAYEVMLKNGRAITFLDTPGHKAFTAMRARGAQVTDIVVIVVAADDGVMPQTVEAIDHAKSAGVPIIFAITKIDKNNADIEKVKRQLSENNMTIEEWGGKYQCTEISSKSGEGIDDLLGQILIESDMLEKKANPNGRFHGTVVESKLDKGFGAVATILVQQGTIRVGQAFLCGGIAGKARALMDERGNRVKEITPGIPVQLLGFPEVPTAGDQIVGYDSEKQAKQLALERQRTKREIAASKFKVIKSLDQFSLEIREGQVKELPIILKGDTDGSIEAISDSLHNIGDREVKVTIVHKGVGTVNESDVLLAVASSAVVIGFHVSVSANATLLAKTEGIDIRSYNVIYDLIEELTQALEGMLEPEENVIEVGLAEVRTIFKSSKVGKIAGCYVSEGKIERNVRVRVYRNDEEIFDGTISALKRFKDDVKVVESGFECGITVSGFDKFEEGDLIKPYIVEKTKRKFERRKD